MRPLRVMQWEVILIAAKTVVLRVVPMCHASAWGMRVARSAVGAKLELPGGSVDGASLALLIAAEFMFLTYYSDEIRVRLLMAVGVGIGFLSHLVLDEMYSVQWDGMKVRLAKSSGSAMKFFGPEALPNGVTMGLLLCLTYATLVKADIVRDPGKIPAPETIRVTSDLEDAPAFRIAAEPRDTRIQ